MATWTPGLPKEPGHYWLYAQLFDKAGRSAPGLYHAQVKPISNGVIVVAMGGFVYRSETGPVCFWTPAILPDLPVLEGAQK